MRRNYEVSHDEDSEKLTEVATIPATVSSARLTHRSRQTLVTIILLTALCVSAYINTGQLLGSVQSELPQAGSSEPRVAATTAQLLPRQKRFAYMFYITEDIYACAALHLMTDLVRIVKMDTARIELVVLHSSAVSQTMLARLQERLRVDLRLVQVEPILADAKEPTWQESMTKLLVFREWGYERIVYMDADSVPMQNLDHLFDLPPAPLHAATAYWLRQPFFASTLMVIEPSDDRFNALIKWARAQGAAAGFDMDILNAFFKDTVQYLPGDYSVLNSDFRAPSDAKNKLYTTITELKAHAKLVHFSCKPDGSYGKPWTAASRDLTFVQGFDPLFAQLFGEFWATEDKFCH